MLLSIDEVLTKRQQLEEDLQTAQRMAEEAACRQVKIMAQLELLAELTTGSVEKRDPEQPKDQPVAALKVMPKRSEHEADLHVLAAAGALPKTKDDGPKKGRQRKHLGQEEIVALLPDLPSRFNYIDVQAAAKAAGHKYVDPTNLRLKLNEMAGMKRWIVKATTGTSTTPNIFETLPL